MVQAATLSFGALLRRHRREAGLTQEELAEQSGLSVRGISDLERDVKQRPHRDTVELLASALHLDGEQRTAFARAARGGGASSAGSDSAATGEMATGLRVFMIADLRGYTRFTQERGDEAGATLAMRFATLARDSAAAHAGTVLELRGDEALIAFSSARDALRAAVDLLGRCAEATVADPSLHLAVGIGLDAGEAIPVDGGYRGGALNLAARLCSLAGPGEILASEAATHLARKIDSLQYGERGMAELRGFADPVRVIEVTPVVAPQATPAEPTTAPRNLEQQLPIGGFLGSLPAGPMVARREELERIISLVEAVVDGRGRLALLAGEPGAGKTRLAQEVTLEARDRGFVIAAGRCSEVEQVAPFYVMREMLAALYALCPSSLQAEIPRRWPDVLRLLPNQTTSGATESEGAEEQQRLFWAVTGFVQACAELAPLALLLDDLHWADGSSLKLLVHLAHHTLQHRVLLLGAYRDVEVGRQHPLERVLVDLERDGLAERIAVRRLAEGDTAALMAGSIGLEQVSDALAELVFRRTEGNPFFVQQVMRALVERGDIYRENGRWHRREVAALEVPESIRAVTGQRLSRLSDAAQETLREASVLGQTFEFDDLVGMGERTEREVEAALEESAASGLIREAGKDGYGFDHALTQQALTAELSARRRRRLHLAAADSLERLPERVRRKRAPEIALHLVEADAGERALPYCLRAGEQAEALIAYSEAEWQYRTALELAREIGDAECERRALEGLGESLFGLARFEETIEVLVPLADTYRLAGDAEGEARAEARIARAHIEVQRETEGIARAAAVAQRLGDHVSPGLARLHTALSMLYFANDSAPEALATAERAVAIAEPLANDRLLADAENVRGAALDSAGRIEEAVVAHRRARQLGERAGDIDIVRRANGDMGWWLTGLKRYEEGQIHLEEALAIARRTGLPRHIAFTASYLGDHFWLRGDWDAAERYYGEGARAGRLLSLVRTNASTIKPSVMRLLHGDRERALQEIDEIGAAAKRAGDLETHFWAEWWLARVDLWEDRPGRAIARMEQLIRLPNLYPGFVGWAEAVLCWAHRRRPAGCRGAARRPDAGGSERSGVGVGPLEPLEPGEAGDGSGPAAGSRHRLRRGAGGNRLAVLPRALPLRLRQATCFRRRPGGRTREACRVARHPAGPGRPPSHPRGGARAHRSELIPRVVSASNRAFASPITNSMRARVSLYRCMRLRRPTRSPFRNAKASRTRGCHCSGNLSRAYRQAPDFEVIAPVAIV
jgi:class 3 adenylate cyclase/tetratricopeptide (TPR) repeat protein